MKQQINLYQSQLAEKKAPLMAGQIGLLLAAGVALLAAAGIWQQWQVSRLEARLQAEQERQAGILRQLSELQTQPPRQKSRLLEQEVARLTAQRDARVPVLEHFSLRTAGYNESGFSSYLAGLARQSADGLWLRGVHLARGGTQVRLTGSAFRPEEIPRYLQRLAGEEAFAGREFSRLQVSRAEAGSLVDFILESGGKP